VRAPAAGAHAVGKRCRSVSDTLNICPQRGGKQEFVFVRPPVAGRESDIQFLGEAQRAAALKEQADAALLAALLGTYATAAPYVAPVYQAPARAVVCTSRLSGKMVYTTCY
jgi:hypothetical protein